MLSGSDHQWIIDMPINQYFPAAVLQILGFLAMVHHEILLNCPAFTGIPVCQHARGRVRKAEA